MVRRSYFFWNSNSERWKGDPVVGNYDLQNKKVFNSDTQDDYEDDDYYETRVQDLTTAVNKEYLNDKFLNKSKDGNHYHLRRMVIKNSEPYYDGLFSDNDLVSKAYIDSENCKQDIAIVDKANKNDVFFKDANGNPVMKDHTITGIRSSSQDGSRPMSRNLDMGGNTVINIKPFVEDANINQVGHVTEFGYFHD